MSTVLLVEDDPDIRHLMAYKLTSGGFDVIEAVDVDTALELARRHPPRIVLLDVKLPRRNGFEVCRELRAAPATADVPIIMVTARAQAHDREMARAAGATDYVIKPFSPRDLLARVEAALARVAI
jgi:two-component system, OmpR family, phosphate regulon response regulator PhoB